MLILPTMAAPDGAARSLELLREVAAQRVRVSLVVFGDSVRPREIASRADVRADGHPFRRVIWIPDPAVLSGDPMFATLNDACGRGDEALALTIRFELSSRLRGTAATSFIELERAFARALAGHVEP